MRSYISNPWRPQHRIESTDERDNMFEYFPNNYTWSSAVNLALMAGGDLGQMDRFLKPLLQMSQASAEDWTNAWHDMGVQQTLLAAGDVAAGRRLSAAARYLRASTYLLTGERQTPPGPLKMASYTAALEAFQNYMTTTEVELETVTVDSPDGELPGYLIHAQSKSDRPPPVVIMYNGFDITKEILYGIIGQTFSRRGVACLVIDTPGTGEPLRLRNVASRHDYEVPTTAIVDYLQARERTIKDVDGARVGLVGISLGGYYAPRGAAFEPRIKACVAWGAIWDYGATWKERWMSKSKHTSVPHWQLPWVMGTGNMESALERVQAWKLAEALSHLTQPFLIVHGTNDRAVPVEEARLVFDAAASTEKTLRVFSTTEGGCEHVGADDPDPTRQFIADWIVDNL
jgi:alpha-beta hydrolase superfamily lysophospholipase